MTVLVQRALGYDVPAPFLLFTVVVPLFILYTHRANVRRLLDGTENRFGRHAEAKPEAR